MHLHDSNHNLQRSPVSCGEQRAKLVSGGVYRTDRVMALGMVLCAGAFLAFVIYQYGLCAAWLPECLFHRWTGLACPGCGMTRATHAALHGRLGVAFRFNPLGMIVVPACVVFVGMRIPAWLRNDPQPLRCRIGACGVGWILVLVLGYWILRNFPVWPFTLLTPL